MKKFKFRLEPILRLKEHREKEKQKIHAAALQQVTNQERSLEDIRNMRSSQQGDMRDHLEGRLNINRLISYNRYFAKLNRDELTGKELLRAFNKNAEDKRLDLVEATKQRRIYEKLRERHRTRHDKGQNLQIQKEQDEIASQMSRHKKTPA